MQYVQHSYYIQDANLLKVQAGKMLIELDSEMKTDVAKILKSMIIDSTVSMVRTFLLL